MEVDCVGGPEDGTVIKDLRRDLPEGYEMQIDTTGKATTYYLHYEKSGRARFVYFKVSLEM